MSAFNILARVLLGLHFLMGLLLAIAVPIGKYILQREPLVPDGPDGGLKLATFIGYWVGTFLLHAALPLYAFQRLGWSPDDDRGWGVWKCRLSAFILMFVGFAYGGGMVVLRILGTTKGPTEGPAWWPNIALGIGVTLLVACGHKSVQLWSHSLGRGAAVRVPAPAPAGRGPQAGTQAPPALPIPPRAATPGKVRLQF